MTCENILHFPPEIHRTIEAALRPNFCCGMNANSAGGDTEASRPVSFPSIPGPASVSDQSRSQAYGTRPGLSFRIETECRLPIAGIY
jgi:hypothetical protein